MGVQWGTWNFAGGPTDPSYLEKVQALLAPFGPDAQHEYSARGLHILYRSFHTTKESRRETQPHVSTSSAVFLWDGRLDNREDLIRELSPAVSHGHTDASIAAAAYDCWSMAALAKLIGDWAVSIWDPREPSLLLAKDFLGSRHLYYFIDDSHITWSTLLDPLVLCSERPVEFEEEYLAGWLGFFPAAHLTPYAGIHSVPPSSLVTLKPGKRGVRKFWDFDPGRKIRYANDSAYEEHFRTVFAQSVRRRLRSDTPVLAELSGGMDSSSIVCVADALISQGSVDTPRLDTVSCYDDSEPNWNEQPYFTKVEQRRGRRGWHIRAEHNGLDAQYDPERFAASPGSRRSGNATKQFLACLASQGNRVVLSGTGGDEVLGGVPTPVPELADLLASGQLSKTKALLGH